MKAYIISVIAVGIIGSFVSILTPEGEGGGIGRHSRLAVGLSLIIVCAAPIFNMISGLRELDVNSLLPQEGAEESIEYESIFNSSYSAAEIESLKEGIKNILQSRFGIEGSECYVAVKTAEDGCGGRKLERIFINLYGSALWKDTGEIEKYLSSLFGCEIVTAVG